MLILPFSSYNDSLSFELNLSYFCYFGAVSFSNQLLVECVEEGASALK